MSLISTLCPRFSYVAAHWSWCPSNLIGQRIFFFRGPCFADFKYRHDKFISSFVHLKLICWIYYHRSHTWFWFAFRPDLDFWLLLSDFRSLISDLWFPTSVAYFASWAKRAVQNKKWTFLKGLVLHEHHHVWIIITPAVKHLTVVIPAQAGIQKDTGCPRLATYRGRLIKSGMTYWVI